jgi:hypothetical protein
MRRLVVAVVLVAAPARADRIGPDELAEPTPRSVHAKLDLSTARLAARFAIPVDGPVWMQGENRLEIPMHAVVIGGVVTVDGASHRLALAPTEDASDAFQAIIQGAPGAHRAWVFHITANGDASVVVDIAAPHTATVELELELSMPTCFYRDVRYALLPKAWATVADAALRRAVTVDDSAIDGACAGDSVASGGQWIGFAARELSARPPGNARIDGFAGRLALRDRDIARVELDLAREISAVPDDLHTAIVIDGSRSLDADQIDAQRAIVGSYLRHAPRSSVQVIAYTHGARALLPGWTTASEAAPRVDREIRARAPRNGSDLDRGLAEAATWLERTEGTRRVVVFTDEHVAQRLIDTPPVALRRLLPQRTLVHVVTLLGDHGDVERVNDTMFAALASATDGIAVFGRVDDKGQVDATMLVRPVSLDQVKVVAPGWREIEPSGCPQEDGVSLAEGSACTWWGEGDHVSGPVTIEGLVWGRRFVRILRPDPSEARAIARTLTLSSQLAEELQPEIDRIAHAVNAAWSLSGTWGGSSGYADIAGMGLGGGGISSSCGGDPGGGVGTGFGTIGAATPKLELRGQFAAAVAACHPGDARVSIQVETTLLEIVGVTVTVEPHAGTPARPNVLRTVHDCVDAAVWDTMVAIPNAPDHATTSFTFGG